MGARKWSNSLIEVDTETEGTQRETNIEIMFTAPIVKCAINETKERVRKCERRKPECKKSDWRKSRCLATGIGRAYFNCCPAIHRQDRQHNENQWAQNANIKTEEKDYSETQRHDHLIWCLSHGHFSVQKPQREKNSVHGYSATDNRGIEYLIFKSHREGMNRINQTNNEVVVVERF